MIKRILNAFKVRNFKKLFRMLREKGPRYVIKKIIRKIKGIDGEYPIWFENHKPSEELLARQREVKFEYRPLISILVPTYNTPLNFLDEMIESVRKQSYENWQLCIADGSTDENVYKALEKYAAEDKRIVIRKLTENGGISVNTNAALELATGDYVGLFDHDDLLTPDCLYYVAKAVNEERYDVLYTDEDKIDSKGKHVFDAHFKPDFSIDLFRTHNYITHFFVAKRSLFNEVGGFDKAHDGAQDYDIMFRIIEKSKKIKHIPEILYHWRVSENSTAGNPESKMYAYEAGRTAIEEHLRRVGKGSEVGAKVEHTNMWGIYKVTYTTPGNPLISIIIPNKDHIDDLDKCVQSIYAKSTYKNYEFIVIENNSTDEKTFEYYKKMEKEHENFHTVYYKGGFNYSSINNFGVKEAKGDYLLFLNNDTELLAEDSLSQMLGICMREDVGAVGAKLLFADDTVQHAGIVLGFGGFAGHVFSGIDKADYGYMLRACVNSNYSAVTAACLMTKKKVFEEVGEFTEELAVALNDVDLCLKIREKGYTITMNAYSLWHHYESKSRGYEDTPEKKARFDKEVAKFKSRWQAVLDAGDPFYNKNFPTRIAPFMLDMEENTTNLLK